MVRKKIGRPAEFRERKSQVVLLEARELAALRRRANTEGVSASAFVRRLILEALTKTARRKER